MPQLQRSIPPVLSLQGVTKAYLYGGEKLTVLQKVSLDIFPGQFLAIIGPSGSGKSTLLGLMAGLDTPTSGTVSLAGVDLTVRSEEELAAIRNQHVGFIFQSFQLISSFTAEENVAIPLELRGDPRAREKARAVLTRVGLGHRMDHTPLQLSGGEQQRVAIARATVSHPVILFADEPTGNLDTANGGSILALLDETRRQTGVTLILVTHDPAIAAGADRGIELRDGSIVDDRTGRPSALARVRRSTQRGR